MAGEIDEAMVFFHIRSIHTNDGLTFVIEESDVVTIASCFRQTDGFGGSHAEALSVEFNEFLHEKAFSFWLFSDY